MRRKAKYNVIFRVPNNDEGKDFLEKANKFLNRDSYSLKLRGRSKNRRERFAPTVTAKWYRIEVPVRQAESWGVYLVGKSERPRVLGISDHIASEWLCRSYDTVSEKIRQIEKIVLS